MYDTLKTMRLPNGLEVAHIDEAETGMLYREIFVERSYLQHGIALRPGDTVLDVGAHIGLSTLFFHTECPLLTIFAFEPAPDPFAALRANIFAHQVNARAVRCGVSDEPGTGRLTYYPGATVMSGFRADPEVEANLTRTFLVNNGFDEAEVAEMIAGRHDGVVVDARLRTLSELIATLGVGSVGLLKIDVEKSELDVLRGLGEDDWPKVRQIVAEVHDLGGALATVTDLLAARGFSVEVDQQALLVDTEVYEVYAIAGGVR